MFQQDKETTGVFSFLTYQSSIFLFDLANLINWFKANMLSLNIAKTNYLLFPSSKLVNVGGNMKLYAGADEIIRNECCKFLGMTINLAGWTILTQ